VKVWKSNTVEATKVRIKLWHKEGRVEQMAEGLGKSGLISTSNTNYIFHKIGDSHDKGTDDAIAQ